MTSLPPSSPQNQHIHEPSRFVRLGAALWRGLVASAQRLLLPAVLGTLSTLAVALAGPTAPRWLLEKWSWYLALWETPYRGQSSAAGLLLVATAVLWRAAALVKAPQRGGHLVLGAAGTGFLAALAIFANNADPWITGTTIGFSLALWKAATAITTPKLMATRLLDQPIECAQDDALERGPLAVDLADLLLTKIPLHCPKAALIAPAGSGKTSVANLVRSLVEAEGSLCAAFESWHYTTSSEAVTALLIAIDGALAKRNRLGGLGSLRPVFQRLLGVQGLPEWTSVIRVPVEQHVAVNRVGLSSALQRKLRENQRLVIVVDDLERADPAVARELLVQAHEIVTSPRIAYLFVFDRENLLARAALAGTGVNESLLEKVFDLTLSLPQPEMRLLHGYDTFVHSSLATSDQAIATWASFEEVLPRSPRRRMRFAIALARGKLERGAALDLRLDLLFALVLMEFLHNGFRSWLRNSPEWQEELTNGAIRELVSQKRDKGRPEPEKPSWLAAPEVAPAFAELRERLGFSGFSLADRVAGYPEKTMPVALHIDWLDNRDLPGEFRAHRAMARVDDHASLQSALESLSSVSPNILHTALLELMTRLMQSWFHLDIAGAATQRALVTDVQQRLSNLVASAHAYSFEDPPLKKTFETFMYFRNMSEDSVWFRDANRVLLEAMLSKTDATLVKVLNEFSRRSIRTGGDDPAVNALDDTVRTILEDRFVQAFGDGSLRETLQRADAAETMRQLFGMDGARGSFAGDLLLRIRDVGAVPAGAQDSFHLLRHLGDDTLNCTGLARSDGLVRALWNLALRQPVTIARGIEMQRISSAIDRVRLSLPENERCDPLVLQLPAEWTERRSGA